MVQQAAVTAYIDDNITETYLQNQRDILRILSAKLHTAMIAVGIDVHKAQGGFYFFLDFHPFQQKLSFKLGIDTSDLLCEDILAKTGVALLPSTAFGFSSSHLSARMAYVDFDGTAALNEATKKGGRIDEELVDKYCANTVEGVDKLCEYFAALDVKDVGSSSCSSTGSEKL